MNTALKLSNWATLLLMSAVVAAQESPPAAPPATPAAAPPARSNAQIDAGEPRATLPATAARPARPVAKAPGTAGPGATDRLSLGTATVTGDREQPKVMYIVPWKGSNIGDLSGKPMNSLLDEALAPVDRDEFKREVAYFDAVRGTAPQNAAVDPATRQGEK